LSTEHYITASQVIVLIRGLSSVCNKLLKEDFHPAIIDLIQDLRRGISNRFQNLEYSKTIALCTFLDPRFKLAAFTNSQAADSIKSFAVELEREFNRQRLSQTVESEDAARNLSRTEKFSVWEEFDSIIATAEPWSTVLSGAIAEIRRYLEQRLLPRGQDPLI
jgi:hypothetical protein